MAFRQGQYQEHRVKKGQRHGVAEQEDDRQETKAWFLHSQRGEGHIQIRWQMQSYPGKPLPQGHGEKPTCISTNAISFLTQPSNTLQMRSPKFTGTKRLAEGT